ncbi:putative transposase-like protein [Phytophthora citrophthora]|uniref:Transposase-like protein n=1 Tax=Phytophthora citrophthora TaxID=4793 RepID=A0AAD9LBK2_9STRA|nr:putative transposase-like protein [Phytophthora citrophthora]
MEVTGDYACKTCAKHRKHSPKSGCTNLVSHVRVAHPNYEIDTRDASVAASGTLLPWVIQKASNRYAGAPAKHAHCLEHCLAKHNHFWRQTEDRNVQPQAQPHTNFHHPIHIMESPHLYHVENPSLFSVATVMEATCIQDTALLWCMEVGLIDWQKLCPTCGSNMKPSCATKRWRCSRRALHANRKEVSRGMLTSSFFSDSKLKLHHSVRLLLAWCMRLPQATAIEMAEVSECTVRDLYMSCRSTCSKELLQADFKIGGEGRIVEIDETSLAKKRKCNGGRYYHKYWLFGGVERVSGRWFGRVVYKRTKATLLPIIKWFIKPRTNIMSNMFATYVSEHGDRQYTLENNPLLLSMEYTHSWVNHSLNFMDPVTGTHTNTIEGLWETRMKRHIKSLRGMTRERLDSYLDEYMWRSWYFPTRAAAGDYVAVGVFCRRAQYPLLSLAPIMDEPNNRMNAEGHLNAIKRFLPFFWQACLRMSIPCWRQLSKHLQSDGLTLLDARVRAPKKPPCLAPDADILNSAVFEEAVVKVLDDQTALLTDDEVALLEPFKRTQAEVLGVATRRVTMTDSLHARSSDARQLWLRPRTSCWRRFHIKHVRHERHRLSPMMLEMILFLKINNTYWGVATVEQCL